MNVTESIINQMIELRLTGMRETIVTRLKQAKSEDLSQEEFFSMLLQDEYDFRQATRIKRLMKRASFRQGASLEEIDTTVPRGLDKKDLRNLHTCQFLLDGTNVIILGPTGVGKTYLATAIGNAACRSGHSTLFYRMNALIEQFALARAKGTYLNLLKRLAGCELLILDDFGIKGLTPEQYQDLYDVIDERGDEKSTIVTTQVPVENWSEVIPDPVTCEAITDRLVSVAKNIVMQGKSYRAKRPRGKSVDKH